MGLTLVIASLAATRDRRRAGLILLIGTPTIAFCLSYPNAGFLAWEKRGGIFYSPFLWIAFGLSLLFFAPFVVSLRALPNKKRAMYLFLITAAIVTPVFVRSQWSASLLPRLTGWSAPTAVLGLFWLGTGALGWEPLVEPRKRSPIKRVLAIVAVCLMIASLDVVITLAFTAWASSNNGPDCGGRRLFTHPVFPGHAVFTARLVHTGHGIHAIGDSTRWAGTWALGIVQEKFWGLPSAWPRFVLLTNSIFWEGDTYLVDGQRAHGFLTGFLPVIEAGPCSRTRSVVDGTVDLRMLREKSIPRRTRDAAPSNQKGRIRPANNRKRFPRRLERNDRRERSRNHWQPCAGLGFFIKARWNGHRPAGYGFSADRQERVLYSHPDTRRRV